MQLPSRRLLGSSAVLVALLLSPNVASAATAYVLGEAGYYEAASGEVNQVTITFGDVEVFRIVDDGATITVGDGCESFGPHEATCRVPSHGLTLSLGDEDDLASAAGVSGFLVMYGADGNDTLEGGLAPDDLQGGPGNDMVRAGPAIDPGEEAVNRLEGGPGNDTLVGGKDSDDLIGGEGADDLVGGRGRDFTTYRGSVGPVGVTLDNVPNDGVAGEGDNTHSDVEIVYGTKWNDRLVGSPGHDFLVGNGANDAIRGRGGNDLVFGLRGDDDVRGGPGHDKVSGGAGADTLYARDGLRDGVFGGSGHDRARVDWGLDSLNSIEAFF